MLSAHSGMASAKLFSDIDQLVKGDVFYIHVLGEVLAYEVDQIATVLPSDTSPPQIEEDKDLVTLVTCTPLGEHPPAAGAGTSGAVCAGAGGRKWKKLRRSRLRGRSTISRAWASALVCWSRAAACFLQGGDAVGKKVALLVLALAVAGLCILLWPVVSGHRSQADMSAAAQGFLRGETVIPRVAGGLAGI